MHGSDAGYPYAPRQGQRISRSQQLMSLIARVNVAECSTAVCAAAVVTRPNMRLSPAGVKP